MRTCRTCLIALVLVCLAASAGRHVAWAAGATATGAATAPAGSAIYVDQQVPAETSATYDPATRRGERGTATAYKTLAGAAAVAEPGQTVVIRAGQYAETLAPKASGLPGRPITYRGSPGEDAVITGPKLLPGVDISGRSHLVIEGLRVEKVVMWLHAVKACNNVIRNNRFSRTLCPGGSAKAGLFFQEAHENRILGNTIEECNSDSLALIRSDRNLVEGNTLRRAGHTLWTIKGGSRNIVRGNFFHNEWQKIGEVFDCEDVGFDHEFNMVNCTKRNLIEGNVFALTASSGNHSPFAGIQYAGQNGIIRRNVFYETVGPALDLTLYAKEAQYTTDNRVYHNVFHKTDYAGISLAGPGKVAFAGNVIKNNILAGSAFVANDTRWAWYTKELTGKPVQLFVGAVGGFVFENNALFGAPAPGEPYLITVGRRDSSDNGPPRAVAWWQEKHPDLFRGNLEAAPLFVDEGKHDYRLKGGSAMIDAGAFLTAAVGAGTGTALPVKDAGYFTDGLGVPAAAGDLVQLEGQPPAQAARVVGIDYEKNVLTLSRPVTWKDGQGVSTAYTGKRPDVGAFEFVPE